MQGSLDWHWMQGFWIGTECRGLWIGTEYTLSKLKYFNTIKIAIIIVALFSLMNSGEPGMGIAVY